MSTAGVPCPFPTPPDLDRAHYEWGPNCGPASIAALLGITLALVRPHLVSPAGRFEDRGFMSPTDMKAALASLGVPLMLCTALDRWPSTGLAFIQWCGDWNGRPAAEQYRHTHWIAVKQGWVYDVNAFTWTSREQWINCLVPQLTQEHAGANGDWWIRTSYTVELVSPEGAG